MVGHRHTTGDDSGDSDSDGAGGGDSADASGSHVLGMFCGLGSGLRVA